MTKIDRITLTDDRVIWEGEGEVVWVEPYGPDAIRVRASRTLRIDEELDWTLLPPKNSNSDITRSGESAFVKNGGLSVEIRNNGTLLFFDAGGELLLEESWIDEREGTVPLRRARTYEHISSDAFRLDAYFKPDRNEKFYGLGFEANDCLDLKGNTIELVQKNTKCSIPFLYSSKGYGFIWNNPAVGRVELANNHTQWHAEAAKQIDYIVVGGGAPAKVMETYTEITGRAPVLPEWAAGFWQCKLRYETQEELLTVAREYKRRNIPLSVIIIDFFHWTQQGEWKFDPDYWPDPEAMVKELNEMGVKVMVSIWPTVDPRSENYLEMREKNYLIKAERGVSVFFMFKGPQTYCDVTSPGGGRFIWERAKENYYKHGIKMFWLDEAEPEMRPYNYDNVRYYIGNGLEVSNIYPYYYAKAFHDGLRAEGEEEVVNLARCAWLGSQRLSTVVWSGDIPSTFDSLRKQLKAGLNFAMAGIPWWTTDIGGFFNGDPDSPDFRELIVRWFQFGLFCPIFRLHGFRLPYKGRSEVPSMDGFLASGGPNEVWSFGEEAYEIITDLIQKRQKMLPYIMKQMKVASENGSPVMRPLFYDFPNDAEAYRCEDEYMFGPDLLVAPVTEQQATARTVYLPAGTSWRALFDGAEHDGGQSIEVPVDLRTIPLFVRDGAANPLEGE